MYKHMTRHQQKKHTAPSNTTSRCKYEHSRTHMHVYTVMFNWRYTLDVLFIGISSGKARSELGTLQTTPYMCKLLQKDALYLDILNMKQKVYVIQTILSLQKFSLTQYMYIHYLTQFIVEVVIQVVFRTLKWSCRLSDVP